MANFNFFKKLLPHSSPAVANAERRALMEAEERAALIAEGKLIPTGPEVQGVGSSRARPDIVDIQDADTLSPKLNGIDLPMSDREKKLRQLKQLASVAGIGTAATLAVNLNDPMGTPEASAQEPLPIAPQAQIAPQIEPVEAETATEKAIKGMMARNARPSEAEIVKPMAKDIDFGNNTAADVKGLEEAQKSRDAVQLINRLGKAADIMGSGMSGTKPQFGGVFDENIKAADGFVTDFQEKTKFEKEDPNSAMSKGYRDIAKSMGFNIKGQASAADLERLMPQLSNIYNQQEAQLARAQQSKENREARRDELELRLANAKEAKGERNSLKMEDKKDKFITNAQKTIGKEYEKYQKMETAFDMIEQAKNDEMGAGDVAILYNFIKTMDPESVVREGEIALGQRGMSLGGRLRTMTLGQLSGELLDKQFRKDVLKIARRLKEGGNNSYNQAVQTIRDTAQQRYGMSEDELTLIDPMLNRKKKEQDKQAASNAPVGKSVVRKGYNAQTNQTQLIYSDGTKEIVNGRR